MAEKPPIPVEKPIEAMTLAELDAEIQELSSAYERIVVSDRGTGQLTSVMARTLNDIAVYKMQRQVLQQDGPKEDDGGTKK